MKKILIIDDSALMRRVISDIIDTTNEYTVAYTAADGYEGLKILESRNDIAICLCDINLPKVSGIEVLEFARLKKINVPFVVISSWDNANDTLAALEFGAVDFIKKPSGVKGKTDSEFKSKLLEALDSASGTIGKIRVKGSTKIYGQDKSDSLKRKGHGKLVVLVCSTGGPKALQRVIPKLPKNLSTPVVIVQHMPVGFTKTMADRLDALSKITVKEAEDQEYLENGVVYIAKGGTHLLLSSENGRTRIVFDDSAPVVGLKPCGNKMYESLCNSFYEEIICVVLTGMGADGTKGIKELEKTNNIYVIAQDEASSTVYGMPRAIYESGLTNVVCDINDVAKEIVKKVGVL